jgi:hypothetical protein
MTGDAQGEGYRAGPERPSGNRKRARRAEAEVSVAQIPAAAQQASVEVKLVSGVEAHLDCRRIAAVECRDVGAAADPDLQLARICLPVGVRLPARFIEVRRGPGGVVAGAPDALLRRNGDDGLGRDGLRGEGRGREENEEEGFGNGYLHAGLRLRRRWGW